MSDFRGAEMEAAANRDRLVDAAARIAQLEAEVEEQVQWVKDLADLQIKAEARIAQLEAALREFCDRVDRGEVKSVTTYAKFKALLEDRT